MTNTGTTSLHNDTICAISTPHGVGGIAVIRVSGPDAISVTEKLWKGKPLSIARSHTAHLGMLVNPSDSQVLDQAVATVFKGPSSYTGQDTVEISVHGSEYVQTELINALVSAGARLAMPGEFTRRAFTAGNLDLAQAEAVADLIASDSEASHRIAMRQMRGGFSQRLTQLRGQLLELASLLELELDFSEEEVEFASRSQLKETTVSVYDEVTRLRDSFKSGAAIRDGIPVAIAGVTNAGKSSLLNALLGDERAIVSDVHGTTRDTVEDTLKIGEFKFRFIDTAGLRTTTDRIEQLGIERTRKAIATASIVVALIDATRPLDPQLSSAINGISPEATVIVALNKTDLPHQAVGQTLPYPIVNISAKEHTGLEDLRKQLIETARTIGGHSQNEILITNIRHARALGEAAEAINRVVSSLDQNLSGDLIAQDLRQTIHILGTILGTVTSTDILTTIFSRFCIGK